MADIKYRDFWDQPQILFFRHRGQLYLFDCEFNEETEDYEDSYRVYLMPELTDADLAGSWKGISSKALRRLGEIPVDRVQFDPSKRRQVDTDILNILIPDVARLSG